MTCPGTISAAFHLTHDCNLRCRYCYTGRKFGAAMTREVAAQGVAFALADAARRSAHHLEIIFFGGEPLLERDLLLEIADRTSAGAPPGLRVSFKLSTNGVLLTEATLDELLRRRIFISISLDGDPTVHDEQRPDAAGHGTSARLAAAIERLLRVNPCANVTCVVTPATAAKLDASVDWLSRRGFAYVSTALDWSAPWTAADLDVLAAAYRRLGDWYFERTRAGEKFYLSCFDERIRTRTQGPVGRHERCDIGCRQFSIAPSGRLYPCIQFVHEDRDGEFLIGDVFRGFDEERRRALGAASTAPRVECDGCALQPRCSSWCACVNWQSAGAFDRPSALVCEHERLLIEIVDQTANRLWDRRDPVFLHKQYNPAWPVLDFAERVWVRESVGVREDRPSEEKGQP